MSWLGDAFEGAFEWLGSSITKGWAQVGRSSNTAMKQVRDGLATAGGVIGAIGLALPFLAPITSLVAGGVEFLAGGLSALSTSFESAINQDNENEKNRLEAYRKPQGSSAGSNKPIGTIIGGTQPKSIPMASDSTSGRPVSGNMGSIINNNSRPLISTRHNNSAIM